MAKKQELVLDFAFFNVLQDYYVHNKGIVKRRYTDLSRKFLNYNDRSVNPEAYLRKPQFEALEMYIFIKEFFGNKQVAAIFEDYMEKRDCFADTSFYAHPETKSGQYTLLSSGAEQNRALFKEMKKVSEAYPNYIYALTMGLGKTVLMATCIFYEFLVANKNPKDKRFCHNALVFAPDKTVRQSQITDFQDMLLHKERVVPPEYVRVLDANIKVHFLEDEKTTLNTLDDSSFNIILSNTQKIIVKKKHTEKSSATRLFTMSNMEATSIMDQALAEVFGDTVQPDDLIFNQRFKKLCRLKQIGIYVDEAHHLFGKELEKELRKGSDTSLRNTINLLAAELERNGSSVIACYNYTGTPYVKNRILPEVVYAYGLREAINNNYLKEAKTILGYENVKDKEFLRDALKQFWDNYGGKTYEGLPAKIAIFGARIAEVTDEIQPVVEEICVELGIPTDTILVNVGDATITKSDDIRDFNNLDVVGTVGSQKQILLLVDKGSEGWNCRSLFAVAMYRSPKSKVFVLQATMRCLRQITDVQQEAMIFLSKENQDILNEELSENFAMTIDDLKAKSDSKKVSYPVRVLPPLRTIRIKTISHKYNLTELEYLAPINFGLEELDMSKYEAVVYEKRGLGVDTTIKAKNIDDIRQQQQYSQFMLVGEIAKYLNKKCTLISSILSESIDGIDTILSTVNKYNEVLYDVIIPKIFSTLYEVKAEPITTDKEIVLLREPNDKEYYLFSALPELVIKHTDTQMVKYKDRSFHADTYCFDSRPEKECFLQYITNLDLVKEVYFTGMFTSNQGDLSIPYYDPETKRMRNYYPDFFAIMKDGTYRLIEVKGDNMIDDTVVLAKKAAAEEIAAENKLEYVIYKGSELIKYNVLSANCESNHQTTIF